DRGALYLLYPGKNGSLRGGHKINETSGTFLGKLDRQYQWGLSLNPALDLDGDGRTDLLVSGGMDNDGGEAKGAFWVLYPTGKALPDLFAGQYESRDLRLTAEDSARIYRYAVTAEDSARIDSMYDLSDFAPSNLVFLLDVSASMNKPRKLPLLRDAMLSLLAYMDSADKISVITYSGKPKVELSGISAAERHAISETITALKSQGSTRPATAIRQAYQLAQTHFIEGGNNRIIFATDGGFETDELDNTLEKNGRDEVPMSVFYFGKLPPFKIDEMKDIARRTYGNATHILPNTVDAALLKEVKVIRENSKD
ncbi:MAG: VWA domain-containing protein, partial [Bacteroidota bacterium]